jgi:hypothetical protein
MLPGALMMCWPALWNRFPLLYPDSMTYLDDGRIVARALFLHRFSAYYGMRSFFYSMVILPLHQNITPWPVIALQAILMSYVLWLVTRSILSAASPTRLAVSFLVLVALLSAFTSLSWYVTLILPDILGPALYLSVYLLVFTRDSLSRWERWSLYPIAWWGITSHATHLLLAVLLCVLLLLLTRFRRVFPQLRVRSVGKFVIVIALAIAAQLALNDYLYGKPSLTGDRPPFLTARVIADGPGLWFLHQQCSQSESQGNWVLCKHLDHVSTDPDNFLWGSNGIWETLTDDENEELMRQEMPFVLATIRAYPGAQLAKSGKNFWDQLQTFRLDDLDPSGYVLDEFPHVLPRSIDSYRSGRQAHNDMPLELFGDIHSWAVSVSAVLILGLAIVTMVRRELFSPRIIGLALVIVSMVIVNAAITGTMSMVEDRLQSRVAWMVPLLAGLWILDLLEKVLPPSSTQSAKESHSQ